MAITTVTSLSSNIGIYYNKVALETLYARVYLDQFGMQEALPEGEGDTVKFNRFEDQGHPGIETGGTTPTEVGMSATAVSAKVKKRSLVIAISDMVDLTNACPTIKAATVNIAKVFARAVDNMIWGSFWKDGGHYLTFSSTATTWTNPSARCTGRKEWLRGAMTWNTYNSTMAMWDSNVSAYGSGFPIIVVDALSAYTSATIGEVASGSGDFVVTDAIEAVTYLRTQHANPFSDGSYVAIMHPDVVKGLMLDTKWEAMNTYTMLGVKQMWRGEAGRIRGMRVIESANAPKLSGVGYDATYPMKSANLYYSAIFGEDAYGITKLEGGVNTYQYDRGGYPDPTHAKAKVSGVLRLASLVLNSQLGMLVASGR